MKRVFAILWYAEIAYRIFRDIEMYISDFAIILSHAYLLVIQYHLYASLKCGDITSRTLSKIVPFSFQQVVEVCKNMVKIRMGT